MQKPLSPEEIERNRAELAKIINSLSRGVDKIAESKMTEAERRRLLRRQANQLTIDQARKLRSEFPQLQSMTSDLARKLSVK